MTRLLVAAIARACALRGDDDGHRADLTRDALELPADAQADLLDHFAKEIGRWSRATGQSP